MKGLKGWLKDLGRHADTAAAWELWAQASRALFVLVGLGLLVATVDVALSIFFSYGPWEYFQLRQRIGSVMVDPTGELFVFGLLVLAGSFAVSLLFGAISLLMARGRAEPGAGGDAPAAGSGGIAAAGWPLYAALGAAGAGCVFLWQIVEELDRVSGSGRWGWKGSFLYVERSASFLLSLVQADIVVLLGLAVILIGLAWNLPARVDRVFACESRAGGPGLWVAGLAYLFLAVSLIPAALLAWSVVFSASTVMGFLGGHELRMLLVVVTLVALFVWLTGWRRNFLSFFGTAVGTDDGARPVGATLKTMLVHMVILTVAAVGCWVPVRVYWSLKLHGFERSVRQKGLPVSLADLPGPVEGRALTRDELVKAVAEFDREASTPAEQIRMLRERAKGESLDSWKLKLTGGAPGRAAVPPEAAPGFDDRGWETVKVGGGPQPQLEGRLGWAWFRTTVTLTRRDLASGLTRLTFWGVDDNAVVYVNGSLAGEHGKWDEPFQFDGRTVLRPGANVIAVCVENKQGAGGIWRPVQVTAIDMKAWAVAGKTKSFSGSVEDMYLAKVVLRRRDGEAVREVRAALGTAAGQSLQRLARVSDGRASYWVWDYPKLAKAPFDHRMAIDATWYGYGTRRTLSVFDRAMVLKAAVDASDGRIGAAWEDLRTVVRLGRLLGQDPLFVSKYVERDAMRAAAEGAVTILLNSPAAELPRDLARDFDNAAATDFFPEAVRASIAWTLDAHRWERRGWVWPNLPDSYGGTGRRPPGIARLDLSLRYLTGAWDASVWSALGVLREFSSPVPGGELEAKRTAFLARSRRGAYFWQGDYDLGNGLYEGYVYICKHEWVDRMWFQLPLVCSGINRYRAQTGRFPASLQDLVPRFVQATNLKDVFTNQWLRYEVRGSGYQILSDGPDGNGIGYWDSKNHSWRTKVLVQYPLPPAVKGDIRIMRER